LPNESDFVGLVIGMERPGSENRLIGDWQGMPVEPYAQTVIWAPLRGLPVGPKSIDWN